MSDGSRALRFGLIGFGRVAEEIHVPALARSGVDATWVAIADPDESRRAAAEATGAAVFASAGEVFDRSIDALLVASPPETHARLALEAISLGVPALVEKPLAASALDLEALGGVDGSEVGVMVGFNRRHAIPFRRLRDGLAGIGKAARLEIALSTDPGRWNAVRTVADALDDLGPHLVDLVRFVTRDEIVSVRADAPGDGTFELALRTERGSVARGRLVHGDRHHESVIARADGQTLGLRLNSNRVRPLGPMRWLRDRLEKWERKRRGEPSWSLASFDEQWRRFAAVVRGETRADPGWNDGVAAVRALGAARRSLREGGEVEP